LNIFDAAFVRLLDPNRIARLPNDPAARQSVTGGTVGDDVQMRGGVSGWRHGRIHTQRTTFNHPNPLINLQFRRVSLITSLLGMSGDSGSPVFVMRNGNIDALVGIFHGFVTFAGTERFGVVFRADEIRDIAPGIEIRPRY